MSKLFQAYRPWIALSATTGVVLWATNTQVCDNRTKTHMHVTYECNYSAISNEIVVVKFTNILVQSINLLWYLGKGGGTPGCRYMYQ